jgi:hypothetical protein
MRKERDAGSVDVAKEVSELLGPALEVYRTILDKENEHASLALRKKTADTVLLELGGFKAPTRNENVNVNLRMGRDDLAELKARGREAARRQGIIIDVTPSTEPPN